MRYLSFNGLNSFQGFRAAFDAKIARISRAQLETVLVGSFSFTFLSDYVITEFVEVDDWQNSCLTSKNRIIATYSRVRFHLKSFVWEFIFSFLFG